MTREEAIRFANDLKNNYTIDFDKLPEFCDLAISALSEKDWKFYYDHGYAQAKRDLSENKGEWKRISPAGIYECSCCGQNVMTNDIECYKFCHGCGASMKGGE